MKIQSVTIVDHEVGDNERSRRKNLRRRIEEFGLMVIDYPFVWGEHESPGAGCESEGFINVGSVNFIHSNNDCALEFIDHVLQYHKDKWVIEYSGGGLAAMTYQSPKSPKHCVYPGVVRIDGEIPTLADFFKAIEQDDENACDILIGFDPILEAKLELLHKLLLPPHDTDSLKLVWDIFLQTLRAYPKRVNNLETMRANWLAFEKGYKSEYSNDPFHPDYVALLSRLRDGLLIEDELGAAI